MAENDATITIGLELDDGTIKKVGVNVNELAEKLGSSLGKKVSSGIDSSLTGLIVQFTAIAKVAGKAFDAVSRVIESAVDEAVQAEQAVALFNATLANSGKFSQAASQDFLDFAASLQRIGTVSDDAVVSAATSLVSIGKLSGDSLKQATQAAVDLAAGLQVDLNTAFDLVAKSAAGNTAALSRYGLKVDESIPKSEIFANVLGQINDRFGGLDATRANTFGGALTQLTNNFNDLLENIGNLIVKSPSLIAVFKFISQSLVAVSGNVADFGRSGDVIRPILDSFLSIARVITQNVLPVFELLLNASKTVFNAILTVATGIGTAFSGVANAATQALNAVGIVSDETAAKVSSNFAANKQAFVDLANKTAESAAQITTSFSITEAVDTFTADLQRAVDTAPPIMENIKNSFVKNADEITTGFRLTAKQLGDIVRNSLSGAISQGVQVLVTNLARGKNAFDGFLKAVLGIIGDMAIQIGTTLIGVGIGIEALKASLLTLSGGQAIAAGIALVAIGALLKSLSGGGGESPTTTQAAGPGGVPGQPDVGITDQPQLDRNRETKVDINIQGNVLDRKETGLEIATVLQEYFDTQDGVLVRA